MRSNLPGVPNTVLEVTTPNRDIEVRILNKIEGHLKRIADAIEAMADVRADDTR